jgi:hypothetical protein
MAASEEIDDRRGDEGRIRASAADIYDRVKSEAAEELDRPVAALAFSGFFAGASVDSGRLPQRPPRSRWPPIARHVSSARSSSRSASSS